jgi:hypothetical protein
LKLDKTNQKKYRKFQIVKFSIFYKISAFLIKIPNEAASPVPTMTAVGVARPRAQGQAITRVDIPKSNAN